MSNNSTLAVSVTVSPDVSTVDQSYIVGFNQALETTMVNLYARMRTDLNDLQNGSADDPRVLAKFQASLQAYETFRNAQSSTEKSLKDLDQGLIQNLH